MLEEQTLAGHCNNFFNIFIMLRFGRFLTKIDRVLGYAQCDTTRIAKHLSIEYV